MLALLCLLCHNNCTINKPRSLKIVQISNAEYSKLVAAQGALSAALKRLADVTEAREREGDDAVPESLRNLTDDDVADAIREARGALADFAA